MDWGLFCCKILDRVVTFTIGAGFTLNLINICGYKIVKRKKNGN